MKNTITTISILLFFVSNALCQVSDTLYLHEGEEVLKEQATYYRVTELNANHTSKLIFKTYHINGQFKSFSNCENSDCLEHDRTHVSYQEYSQIEGANDYLKGSRAEESKSTNHKDSVSYKLLIDGYGSHFCSSDDTTVVYYKSVYKEGSKYLKFKGYSREGRLKYEETYKNGTSWDKEGNEYKYKELETQAQPIGGMELFYQYVGKTLNYPDEAKKLGKEGKVFVQFVVDKNGKITKVKTTQGIGYGCDQEAERILKNTPNWSPKEQRGQALEFKMILPITFKLHGNNSKNTSF